MAKRVSRARRLAPRLDGLVWKSKNAGNVFLALIFSIILGSFAWSVWLSNIGANADGFASIIPNQTMNQTLATLSPLHGIGWELSAMLSLMINAFQFVWIVASNPQDEKASFLTKLFVLSYAWDIPFNMMARGQGNTWDGATEVLPGLVGLFGTSILESVISEVLLAWSVSTFLMNIGPFLDNAGKAGGWLWHRAQAIGGWLNDEVDEPVQQHSNPRETQQFGTDGDDEPVYGATPAPTPRSTPDKRKPRRGTGTPTRG